MQCISCGKDISAAAKVCPYCHRDTKESSQANGVMYSMVLLGGLAGYAFYDGVGAFIGAILVGGIGGAV